MFIFILNNQAAFTVIKTVFESLNLDLDLWALVPKTGPHTHTKKVKIIQLE